MHKLSDQRGIVIRRPANLIGGCGIDQQVICHRQINGQFIQRLPQGNKMHIQGRTPGNCLDIIGSQAEQRAVLDTTPTGHCQARQAPLSQPLIEPLKFRVRNARYSGHVHCLGTCRQLV